MGLVFSSATSNLTRQCQHHGASRRLRSDRPILSKDVVKGLMSPARERINVHRCCPSFRSHAGRLQENISPTFAHATREKPTSHPYMYPTYSYLACLKIVPTKYWTGADCFERNVTEAAASSSSSCAALQLAKSSSWQGGLRPGAKASFNTERISNGKREICFMMFRRYLLSFKKIKFTVNPT